MTPRLEDLFSRLDAILTPESPMHPIGCSTWQGEADVAVDMAKDALREFEAEIAALVRRRDDLLETTNRYLSRARQAEYALAAQRRLLTVTDWMAMNLAPEETPVLAQFRAWNRPEAELMEQVVWFIGGAWRAYPQVEGTAFADRWKPLYNAAHFTSAELEHLLALVKGGTGGTKPGGGFTAEGVLALKAKLAGMVDGPL